MHSDYHEGVLQLRNTRSDVNAFVESQVRKACVFIVKTKRLKNGVDLYISSQHFLQNLGKRLRRNFGGELKVSRKLHTVDRQTSRRVYRITVLFRAPKFCKNDVVRTSSCIVKISSVGKTIHGTDISCGKKVTLSEKDVLERLEQTKTIVASTYPSVMILDPNTYQPCEVRNQIRRCKRGEQVEVVHLGGYWLVP